MSSHEPTEMPTADSKLLELEYQYAAQNMIQYEDLRSRLFQLYTILTGVVLVFGPMLSTQKILIPILQELLVTILVVLLIFGVVIVIALGRLRLLTISTYRAQNLIRAYYIKYHPMNSQADLKNSLLWGESSIPLHESFFSHSFLTSFLAILLNA